MDDTETKQPSTEQEQQHAAKSRRSRRKTNIATEPVGDPKPPSQEPAKDNTEPKQEWVSKLPEPFGRHIIDLGDGRRLRLLRSNRWQQAQIAFLAPEGEDPKPDAKYTRWLREHGWQWRSQDKAWTKQFDKNSEENRYARSNSDLVAQLDFVALANLIRLDKGMEPVLPISEQRGVGG